MTGGKMRRKIRKRKTKSENSRMKMGMFVGIILLAVVLGFLTARFVIGPIIGYNADESPVKLEQKDDKGKKTDAEQTEQKASLETGQNQMPEDFFSIDLMNAYEELGSIRVIDEEGEGTSIIEKGRFVLPGTEELNLPFEK